MKDFEQRTFNSINKNFENALLSKLPLKRFMKRVSSIH